MTNHPNRPTRDGWDLHPISPDELRDLIAISGLTQARAAELAGVALRTMEQYLAGNRRMPLSASMLLLTQCVLRGMPAELVRPWLGAEMHELLTKPAEALQKQT